MKILVGFLVFLFLFQSCDLQDPYVERKYILENGTQRDIEIEFFRFNRLYTTENIIGMGILEEIADNANGKQLSAFSAFYFPDSVIVTFDDEKYQTYIYNLPKVSPDHQWNILSDSAYVAESNELYRFTFTEEDYERAEPIEDQ